MAAGDVYDIDRPSHIYELKARVDEDAVLQHSLFIGRHVAVCDKDFRCAAGFVVCWVDDVVKQLGDDFVAENG